jgi:hypothetical protein
VRARDEDGVVLLLALGFLLFFGLVIGALLGFAESSTLATEQLRDQRSTVYTADGATDAAIQVARTNVAVGAFGAGYCDSSAPFMTVTATAPSTTVATVTCSTPGDPLAPDRTITFTTKVSGINVIVATVRYHDSSGAPPDVQSWAYCGHDPGVC